MAEPNPPAANPPAADAPKGPVWGPYVGMFGVGLILLVLGIGLVAYIHALGPAKLASIESMRPLLVLAAIVSTITFGGALLFGALFADGPFEDRFRRAREIFLVFSGVFGTVVGFYFGAGETHGPQLSLNTSHDDTRLTVYALGGTPPYKVSVTYGEKNEAGKEGLKSEESADGWARFTFDKAKDCIQPLKVSVADDKGLHADKTIALDAEKLKDWPACAAPPKPSPPAVKS